MIIWIVEWFTEGKYQPTPYLHYTRQDARNVCREYKKENPTNKFRVVKYYRSYYQY
jgi:hypothetical protein